MACFSDGRVGEAQPAVSRSRSAAFASGGSGVMVVASRPLAMVAPPLLCPPAARLAEGTVDYSPTTFQPVHGHSNRCEAPTRKPAPTAMVIRLLDILLGAALWVAQVTSCRAGRSNQEKSSKA